LVEGAIPVAIAVLCSDLPSLSAMRPAAKQWALSASVSQSLSVWICGQRLTRTSSGRELAPIVFGFEPEAARGSGDGRSAVSPIVRSVRRSDQGWPGWRASERGDRESAGRFGHWQENDPNGFSGAGPRPSPRSAPASAAAGASRPRSARRAPGAREERAADRIGADGAVHQEGVPGRGEQQGEADRARARGESRCLFSPSSGTIADFRWGWARPAGSRARAARMRSGKTTKGRRRPRGEARGGRARGAASGEVCSEKVDVDLSGPGKRPGIRHTTAREGNGDAVAILTSRGKRM
jgi:hypothetical protein